MHGNIPSARGPVDRNDNGPPSPIEQAKEAMAELVVYLKDNPVILTYDEAKTAGGWVERTLNSLKDARAARDAARKPHNDALAKLSAEYDIVREKSGKNEGGMLQRAYDALKARITKFALDEEAKRDAAAEKLREEAEEAERQARAAEAAEQEAIANAEAGECADVGGAIEQADEAFSGFQKTNRQAAVAERNVRVRIASVMGGNTISMRGATKPVIEDGELAFKTLGLTDKIQEAILASAKDYKNTFGEWPDGIGETYERKL